MKKSKNIKKIAILFSVFIFLFSAQTKAQEAAPSQTAEIENLENTEIDKTEEEVSENNMENGHAPAPAPIKAKVKAESAQELREMIQNKKQETENELEQKEEKIRFVHKNQNKIKEAAHAMLAMENLINGIGQRVSEIAQEFNNSLEKTIRAEEKIQTKNRIMKFFFGGSRQAAEELDEEIGKNQIRLKELKNLRSQCDCEEEVKKILEEEVKKITEEQNRLQELVVKEKQNKGLFGTIISWFKK